ncbi:MULTISPECIES: cysteine hydrolase [Frankia]|nr:MULTISPECIES: cysteine hydrolase [Frankia]
MMSNNDTAGKRPPRPIDPRTSAVVLVECQNGVLGPDSMLPSLAADSADIRDGLRRLVTAARSAGVLVVHATFEGWLGSTDPGTAPLWRTAAQSSKDWGPGHPATQVVPDLLDPTDLIIPRHHGLSPTWGSELLPILRGHRVNTVVFAGVSLNVAIPLAVGQTVHEGFHVIVTRDAAASTPAEYGQHILANTIAMLARVTTVDDLAAAWAAATATV